ncbi:hypothetical protein WDU94_009258 [Cyamophila willieti]
MPNRGKKGWCGCLQDDEPPEITYCMVDNAGTLAQVTFTPTLPIPPTNELNTMFEELVEELDLTAPNKAAMLSLPDEKKWQIYCSRKMDQTNGSTTDAPDNPEQYIEQLRNFKSSPLTENDDTEIKSRTRILDSLRTALRTQPHSFVLRFIECEGLLTLLEYLKNLDHYSGQTSLHCSIIGCIKALMNNSTGRSHVLGYPGAIDFIAQSLSTDNIKTKIAVLEILGAVCLIPGGHKKVLDAMSHYQRFCNERSRFQGIVNDLDKSTGVYRTDVSIKTALMSFLNAVLSYGPGQHSLEFRLHLRYEVIMLGIQPIIDKLRTHENETLDRHLDFFEMLRNEDECELARKYETDHIETKSATSMFNILRRKLGHTAAYPHFLSLLHHLILLPLEFGCHPQHWLLLDRLSQQLTLQTETGEDYDHILLKINVKKVVHLLAKEEEIVAAKKKADELEMENVDLSNRLAKKEQELDQKTQEKEDLDESLSRVKDRLEKETAGHLEAKQKVAELEDRISELKHRADFEQDERKRLENLINSGSVPDDTKAVGLSRSASGREEPTSPRKPDAPAPCIPPPPPPANLPPPPPPVPNLPPPPCPGIAAPTFKVEVKNVPPASAPLKSFNWAKLPDTKVNGTIWTELDESKLYASMELEVVDKLFCAYQKNGVPAEGSVEDLTKLGKISKSKILSVIDGRRAQNCTILLSKLKMTDEEISKAILSMDSGDQLPLDMLEQLLKFTPNTEEAALLEEHSTETLARADRFLYEISKIPHYEQRLRCLHYKKRFSFWISDIEPKIKSVMEASREVTRSRRLRRLLELVLALGNYMNKGARGNASGFRLTSLNKLVDTKSSSSRGVTLLHYLVELAEKRFKEVLKLEEDLSHVKEASKVSMKELECDMTQLRNNLKEVSREIEFQRVQPLVPGDRFLPVMKEFLTSATCRLSEIEDLFQDMKTRFDRAVRLFGEDNSSIQPEDFFVIFDTFLTTLHEAKLDNENMKRKREEEEKRAKQDAEIKKRTTDRKQGSKENGVVISNGSVKGEFDDLISALRTGDVFGEDSIAKIKRSRRSRHSPSSAREDTRERVIGKK